MQNDLDRIQISDKLEDTVNKSLGIIDKKHKKKLRKKIIAGFGSMAAAAALFLAFCITNPVLAAKLPLIGNIFEKTEDTVSYKGDYSKISQTLIPEMEETDTQQLPIESPYIQTSNGITMTISEVYYNSKALYLAMSIENEEEFPADFNKTQNMEGYILDYDRLEFQSTGTLDFYNGDTNPYYIEGKFENMNLFTGIVRVDIGHLSYWPTEEEIQAAGIELWEDNLSDDDAQKRYDDYNLKLKEAFPKIGETITAPEHFIFDINITQISSDLFDTKDEIIELDGEMITMQTPIRKEYAGAWNFQLDVTLDMSKTSIVEVNDTNDEGVGIMLVEKTPYEISAKAIIPTDKLSYDYFTVICDANGDQLDFQGTATDTYQVYGRDLSTVYVYVCDYVQYMDELKGYFWSPEYAENKKEKTFAQYLDEKAVYGTEVNFSEENK